MARPLRIESDGAVYHITFLDILKRLDISFRIVKKEEIAKIKT